ncbi:MAG: cache domain-containing protein, partial [Spirochaetes bacterium]|nr:cache domain-containing protein [Spirochaetota bacterium]
MKSISAKIVTLAASAVLLIAFSLTTIFLIVFVNSSEAQLSSMEALLNQDFDVLVKTQVETAASMLQTLGADRDAGLLSADEALESAKRLLRNLKFGEDGYFWADTPDGYNVVYLGKDSEGKNRLNDKDANGFEL